jgi:dual specificity tyrosine-phosphorylation-regulated kinase 2/3/4
VTPPHLPANRAVPTRRSASPPPASAQQAHAASPVLRNAPVDARTALARCASLLNAYEAREILAYAEVYYVGVPAVKVAPTAHAASNFGFDTASHHYRATPRDHIAYRYEIRSVFGRGAFGQVLKCYDHRAKGFVAVKVVINTPQMLVQGRAEMAMIAALNAGDPSGQSHIVRMLDTFEFRGHVCAVFEVLGQNLYEYSRRNGFRPMQLADVRRVARQMLRALAFTHAHGIVHCDMKPENVLLVPDASPLSICVIDYGSACRVGQRHFDYIQSRFYRAPEVILGIPYGPPMDLWSFACIVAELVAGRPLFPGDSEDGELRLHMEVLGQPPPAVIADAPRAALFFAPDGRPRTAVKPGRSLERASQIHDPQLLELLARCLDWHQRTRITAEQALEHEFFAVRRPAQPPRPAQQQPERVLRRGTSPPPSVRRGQSPPRKKTPPRGRRAG